MILADTGPLVAAWDRDDRYHQECAEAVAAHEADLVVPGPVVVEVCWLLGRAGGADAEAAFLRLVAGGVLPVVDLVIPDYVRMTELVTQYHDLPDGGLGMVDAAVVAIAERLNVQTILTLNRRDFSVVRPRHVDALELVPGS